MVGDCRKLSTFCHEKAVSPRAPERASKWSNYHDLSFSDRGPELRSLSLAIVLGVGNDSLYDYNVLLVDHSHGGQCLLLARSV